jgi:hypothetical protein
MKGKKMGFFNLDGIFEAHREGRLQSFLEKMSLNDLAILKMELEGFEDRMDRSGKRESSIVQVIEIIDGLLEK